jgi:hypothetical protein
MPSWPGTLPDVLASGYSEDMANLLLRSDMDTGPAKVRKRISYNTKPISASIVVNSTQVATFETFFYTTLLGGSLTWTATHPRTGASVDMRFNGVPKISSSDSLYTISMNLEVMP